MGRHVAPKRKRETKTKPFKPVLILDYKDFSGYWEYTVIMPNMVVGSGSYNKYQTWYEAKDAAEESWARYMPGSPPPEAVVCYTYEAHYKEILKAGWR